MHMCMYVGMYVRTFVSMYVYVCNVLYCNAM